ncbi:carboxypeptidase-like regulatory domain-containing protein [Rufibacter radiotolerans]|uniref:carboxypeptidase-like regulatory domain-containing protein n=1 Tax=Rufibacter radiotolerans TaxID=1379910 RepID=UPI000AC288A9|nr:carboxypeptidase-like regulatory domain-containing protein [Rufibacter radiotolerans]
MKKLLLFSLLLLSMVIQDAIAQTKTITGKVTEAGNNQGMPGVTVLVKGTQVATATGADGSYSLSVPAGSTTLVYSFVGYKTAERAIGSNTTY